MKKGYTLFTGAMFLVLLATSCKTGKLVEQPVTAADAKTFSQKMEQAIAGKRGSFIDESLNPEVFYNRVVNNAPGEKPLSIKPREFRSMISNMKLGTRIVESVGSDGTFKMFRHYEKSGKQHLLYRMYSDDGINYYDFELTSVKGKVGIADIFVYLSGQPLSETARELIVQVLSVNGKGSEFSKDDERKAKKMTEIRQLMQQEKNQEVVDIIDGLPAQWKKIRVFMMLKLVSASRISPEKFESAHTEYKASFPGEEEKMGLMLLDGYIMQKKFDKAIEGVNGLDRQLGTDPLLDLQRGSLFYQSGQSDSAIWYFERLVRNVPDFGDGYSQLIQVYMLEGKAQKAMEMYKDCREKNYLSGKNIELLEENYPSLAGK
jgi:tetratricopeptide (TPR) repeat protein